MIKGFFMPFGRFTVHAPSSSVAIVAPPNGTISVATADEEQSVKLLYPLLFILTC